MVEDDIVDVIVRAAVAGVADAAGVQRDRRLTDAQMLDDDIVGVDQEARMGQGDTVVGRGLAGDGQVRRGNRELAADVVVARRVEDDDARAGLRRIGAAGPRLDRRLELLRGTDTPDFPAAAAGRARAVALVVRPVATEVGGDRRFGSGFRRDRLQGDADRNGQEREAEGQQQFREHARAAVEPRREQEAEERQREQDRDGHCQRPGRQE